VGPAAWRARSAVRRWDERRINAFTPTSKAGHERPPMLEHEYQIRLGATIRVLRDTLPQFMEQGLVDRTDIPTSGSLSRLVGPRALMRHAEPEHIYHPHIHFRFRAGLSMSEGGARPSTDVMPAPQKQGWAPTFSLQGRRTYLLSAYMLRHALHAWFVAPEVHLEHLAFLRKPTPPEQDTRAIPRDELLTRIRFRGVTRVGHAEQDYTVVCRYRFDRRTAMICEHIVDKMVPLPGFRMWQSLSTFRHA